MNSNRPFSAKYLLNLLELKQGGDSIDRIGATLYNSKIKLTPHQIQAALFAFKSPLSNGCILADEVGLGKTIEAGIVLAQLWNEHKRKILVVAPASLMRQWSIELFEKFALPSIIMDRKNYRLLKKDGYINPFDVDNQIIICSHQMCSMLSDDIKKAKFDLCIIDEAHKLRNVWTGKNITSVSIKNALNDTKKILLTATPIQNNVMDLYGLSSLIDDNIFGDAKIFREKYYKDYSTNIDELKTRLKQFTHRTLREQVQPYIKFTKRLPKTFTFEQTNEEKEVYNAIRNLLLNSDEDTYLIPKKQKHLLLLILCKLMGSSIHSIVYTLETMKNRLINLKNGEMQTSDSIIDEYLISEDIDIENEDELELDNELVEDKEIDENKLNSEINNLENIIEIAKKVNEESKYNALKKSIEYGFNFLSELSANKKILIFTESTRTQQYIYNSLINDGYKNIVTFNGSNNDDTSQKIYSEWCQKPENCEKLNNSKNVNMRQAIIDYFKEDGEILIATGAGAEGLNLQFCSMVINYDLPWNPQIVEQRIGRCHRFGQKHDVVVINFLSSTNTVEQRVYELLSTKFKVFNEVFGSSDAILGVLEDGIDLQKRIIEIYTKCRNPEEINRAFDEIQEQYKDLIDESLKQTRKELIENFDEDLQNYFDDIMQKTQDSIGKFQLLLWRITKIILSGAKFDDDKKTFIYNGIEYILSNKDDSHFIEYNMTSKLGLAVLDYARTLTAKEGHINFDISNYPFKLTNILELKGKKGLISFNKIIINSFEQEEYVFFNGILEDGTPIKEDIIEKLFRLDTLEQKTMLELNKNIAEQLFKDVELHSKKIVTIAEERNNAVLNEEIAKINNWAEDKIESVQLKVEQMRAERKNLQKQSDIAENTLEKKQIEEAIEQLSKKIKNSWLELADAEDEIEIKRKDMISKIKKQLMKDVVLENVFVVSFDIR